jgi:hypothetical protein
MSKIHILESNNAFGYKVAIHFPTPIGNNSVGNSWKSCALSAGNIGSTVLSVGTEPGNITPAEYDSIIAGDTVECIETICPGLNPANAAVEHLVDMYIVDWKAYMSRVLKYYGHKIEAV